LTELRSGEAPRQRGDIAAYHDHGPSQADFGALFMAGLARSPKNIAGQMLLDRRSPAFHGICALPEYYLQRVELEIVRDHGAAIAQAIGRDAQLIDFGSAFSLQMEWLLAALDQPWAYVIVDRDRDPLLADARRVQREHPALWVEAVRADLRQGFDLPPNAGGGRRVAYFPGNAIGTFEPAQALELLSRWAVELRTGGQLLVGVDLRKSLLILEAAYDDSRGLNAELMFDLLRRANRELAGNFDVRLFEHRVRFDAQRGSVSADLVSIGTQEVRIDGQLVRFEQHEAMHVEESWKYSVEDFQALARGAGFRPVEVWFDRRQWFGLFLLEVG
jgi:dimethylhistidine N-methyltransferase